MGSEAKAQGTADHPVLAWRRAGLMSVTGRRDGPGLICPAPLATAADAALMALRGLAHDPSALPACGALLLGERARLMGLRRGGRTSANGSCRLLDARDGRIALNLAREDDWDLMPILLDCEGISGWDDVARCVVDRDAADLVALGVELGLPIALDAIRVATTPFAVLARGPARPPGNRTPLVLDFSALWAGPMAASLLGMMGADVVKVESVHRPDGARRGHAGFFDLMNGGKRSVAVDFRNPAHQARLLALVDRADMVIEGSRPRALRRLGIDREAAVARGCVWISITGHDDGDRVGFGDDAAIAAGLASVMEAGWGEPMFAGDAIADPLTGLHAALAGWTAWEQGQGALIHLSLANMVAFAMQADVTTGEALYSGQATAVADAAPLYPLRAPLTTARETGADNGELLGL